MGEPSRSMIGKIDLNDKPDEKQSLEMARQMVEKLKEERRERKKRLKQLKQEKKQRREKMKQEKEAKLEAEEREKQQKFQEKQDRIRQKIEKRKAAIQKSKTEMMSETRKRVRRSPLHSKIESDFEEHHLIPGLEKRKQVLAQIRNFHQPIRLTNIKVHAQQKEELLKEKLQEYFKKREHLAECNKDTTDKYNSHTWKLVKEREEQEKEEETVAKEDIKNRQRKRIEYARNVMSLYKPKISEKKKLEMSLIRKNMDDPHSLSKVRRGLKSTQHRQNLSMMSPTDKGISTDTTSQVVRRKIHTEIKPLDEKRYSYHPTPKDKHPFIKHDYLTATRQKKDNADKEHLYSIDQWQNELMKANLTDNERIEYIKMKSAQMEEEMKRKEALMKLSKSNTIDQTRQIDGILIDSIKTKLDLLSGMS